MLYDVGMDTANQEDTMIWWRNRHEVGAFAHAINYQGLFTPPGTDDAVDLLLDYFDRPWNWNAQHEWWEANSRTDSIVLWDEAADNKYRIRVDA